MEIAIIHNGTLNDLKAPLQPLASITEHPNLQLLSSIESECVVLDADVVSQFELSEKGQDLSRFAFVFYLAESFDEDLRYYCESNHIVPIEKKDVKAALNDIKRILFPKDEKANRLFLFIGADRKVGTTSIVQAVASELSQMSSRKTLIVSLTRYPNSHLQLKHSSIDELKTRIRTHVIEFTEIIQAAELVEGKYYFLGGSRDILQANQYAYDDWVYLMQVLRDQDEFNVLVDVESDMYNAMTFAALKEIRTKFLVMKPLESYYERFEQCVKQVYSNMNLTRNNFKYILNCFDESVHPMSYLKAHDLMSIAKVRPSHSGELAENQRVALHGLDKGILKDVAPIANLIAVQSGTKVEQVEEKKGLLGKLFKRKEVAHV